MRTQKDREPQVVFFNVAFATIAQQMFRALLGFVIGNVNYAIDLSEMKNAFVEFLRGYLGRTSSGGKRD